MYAVIFINVIFVVWGNLAGQTLASKCSFTDQHTNHYKNCFMNISKEDPDNGEARQRVNADKDLKHNVLVCTLIEEGLIDEKGNFNEVQAKTSLRSFSSDPYIQDELEISVDICSNLQEENVRKILDCLIMKVRQICTP